MRSFAKSPVLIKQRMASKTQNDVYRQRTDAFMLAMAFAKKLGHEVGVRDGPDWPVLVIVLENGKEVAIHARAEDVESNLLDHRTDHKYDEHTDKEKEARIRAYVADTFAKK